MAASTNGLAIPTHRALGKTLSLAEASDLRSTAERREQIDELKANVQALPPPGGLTAAFAPTPPAASDVSPAQPQRWLDEQHTLERQAADLDAELLTARALAKEAANRQMSKHDADL